jgi:predicted phosphodiesterase
MENRTVRVHTGEEPKLPGFVRFVCLSDTHNRARHIKVPSGDVLLHAGDFSGQGDEKDVLNFSKFLSSQPHTHKVVIAGNHDLSFDLENQGTLQRDFLNMRGKDAAAIKSKLTGCIYLEDSACVVEGYRIWGSPWTPTFFDWGFNLDRGEKIAAKWALIPNDTEILITHGPPFGIQDTCQDGFRAGCQDLLEKIQNVKPLVHVFGHIHEAYGVTHTENTTFINASNCTLRYQPLNPPLVFDLPARV